MSTEGKSAPPPNGVDYIMAMVMLKSAARTVLRLHACKDRLPGQLEHALEKLERAVTYAEQISASKDETRPA